MSHDRRAVAWLLLGLFGNTQAAQAVETIPVAQPNPAALSEKVDTETKVAGLVLNGLILEGKPESPRSAKPDLFAWLPSGSAGRRLCLRLVSRDGLYSATNEYLVPTTRLPGFVRFAYPTVHEETFRDEDANAVAALVYEQPCEEPPSKLYAVRMNTQSKGNADIVLHVNAVGAKDVVVAVEPEKGRQSEVACKEIGYGRRTAFDMVCRISRASLAKRNRMEVLRFVGGQMAKSSGSFVLELP